MARRSDSDALVPRMHLQRDQVIALDEDLARLAPAERQWLVDGAAPGSRPLDRFEQAVVFAMREASRMKVERS